MSKEPGAADSGNGRDAADDSGTAPAAEALSEGEEALGEGEETLGEGNDVVVTAATVGGICVGAALIESALIPGMIIGVAAMLVPRSIRSRARRRAGHHAGFRG
jgi:hypothetical protein